MSSKKRKAEVDRQRKLDFFSSSSTSSLLAEALFLLFANSRNRASASRELHFKIRLCLTEQRTVCASAFLF